VPCGVTSSGQPDARQIDHGAPCPCDSSGTTYSVELALQVIDAPAVKGERHDAVLPIELGDLVRDGVRIDGRSDRRNESEFRPRGVEGEHSNVPM